MKKDLLIDFDGTLCFDYFWRSLSEEENSLIQTFLFKENGSVVGEWMRGKHTSEEINYFVSRNTGIDYSHLWNAFINDCESMVISKIVLKKIKDLKEHYRIILVTDNMDSLDRFTIPSLKLDEYFDSIVNSYNEGILKEDNGGRTFKNNCKKIQESILIDNSKSSCSLFESLGGTSFLVSKEKDLNYYLDTL